MDLQHLHQQVARDLVIDKNNLDESAVKVPILYSKYLQLHSECVLMCLKLQSEYDELAAKKYMYYRNDYEVVLKNKAEIDVMMAGDKELQKLKMKLEYEKSCANYLESVCKQISGLSYLIKDAIEFRKFAAGI